MNFKVGEEVTKSELLDGCAKNPNIYSEEKLAGCPF